MRRRGWSLLVAALVAGFASGAARADEFPRPQGRVNDFAGLLSAEQRANLAAQIEEVEQATSAELALVTVPSLGGRTVEDYANRLFNEWGIGKGEADNGVLILVAPHDREMRIEVGYGLEGILPDGLAGAVIREQFLPRFRDGDYAGGILAGTARVAEIVRRNETLTPEQRAALDRAAAEADLSWGAAAMLSLFVGFGAFIMGTAAGARVVTQMIAGAIFMGFALFMALVGTPRPAVALLALLAVAVTAWGIRLGRKPSWRRGMRGTGKGAGGSGWMLSGSGGSGSSGGSSSSGGSFGGGSSGGGGASGRW